MKNILIILGGLAIGGVETYIVRLSKELNNKGISIRVILLSSKYDEELFNELNKYATVTITDRVPFLNASSWVNAFLPFNAKIDNCVYDLVHVVDLLTLSYIYLNKEKIKFNALSIGIYHSKEIVWWRDKNIYFRKKILSIYDKNIKLNVFPSESIAKLASDFAHVSPVGLDIVPLGIDMSRYQNISPSFESKKIISIGRLVDFKTYNKQMISQLKYVREYGNYEYYIYGNGPQKDYLIQYANDCGVGDYVHFMGEVTYSELHNIFNNTFCFIGSGTTIIEASAAGVPSIVGIESLNDPLTSGLFCDINGYSYNESFANSERVSILSLIENMIKSEREEYFEISNAHRKKAAQFDISNTASIFLDKSIHKLDTSIRYKRIPALISFVYSILRFGAASLKSRFNS